MNRSETDRIGVSICQETFSRLGFIFREQTVMDYGVDAIIEQKEDRYASGRLIGVQIKSGNSFFRESNDNAFIYRGDMTHYRYWLNYCLPVIIVLVDTNESKRECYWQRIEKGLTTSTEKGWKIEIPKKNKLKETARELHQILDSQNENERRLNTLLFSLDWMRAASNNDGLFLEVNEWVNKSSGRGDFKLFVFEKDGSEQIISERTYLGFGVRDFSLVIKDMFPWANINIDEDFYEYTMDREWHEQYENAIEELSLSLLSQDKSPYQRIDKIYPYENVAGEVDKYRLILTLNDLGRAFLLLNDFLNKGNCYYLS